MTNCKRLFKTADALLYIQALVFGVILFGDDALLPFFVLLQEIDL